MLLKRSRNDAIVFLPEFATRVERVSCCHQETERVMEDFAILELRESFPTEEEHGTVCSGSLVVLEADKGQGDACSFGRCGAVWFQNIGRE
mmetsp:Transcript_25801/g.39583  ORF Transcript_25801/g.39583 Transcript_25801/m.39583 type:complete len:91 (-) Transcript_25801:41-313(-)